MARVPVLCMWARSGAGKSSLLAAGLIPALREEGVPEALSRAPHEAALPRLLLRQLMSPTPEHDDPRSFAETLARAHRLAGRPPVLVLDQFEELFKGSGAAAARAWLGPYIAASIGPGPTLGDGVERPLCRWLLAYRHEFHGDVKAWLRDILADARRAGRPVDGLPHDLTVAGRSDEWPLPLFGSAVPGEAPHATAMRAFVAAISAPLGRTQPPWSMAEADARRLAEAFANVRVDDAGQPLVPELQVVLARLVRRAREAGTRTLTLEADRDLNSEIRDALRSHVLSSIERVLPLGAPGVRQRRALLLTMLERLVDGGERRTSPRPAAALLPILGGGSDDEEGARLLDALTGPGVRLLVVEADPESGPCYALGHDRLAEVIAELHAEAPHGTFDAQTLDLIEFVHRRVELHRHGDPAALGADDARFDRLAATPTVRGEAAAEAWWTAWSTVVHQRRDRSRAMAEAAARRTAERRRLRRLLWAALTVGLVLTSVLWIRSLNEQLRVERESQRIGYTVSLSSENNVVVLRALHGLMHSGLSAEEALARLPDQEGANPWIVLVETFVEADVASDVELRLTWLEAMAAPEQIRARNASNRHRLDRIGRLLTLVEILETHLGDNPRLSAARAHVERTLAELFPMRSTREALLGPMKVVAGGQLDYALWRDPGRQFAHLGQRTVASFAIGITEVTNRQFAALASDLRGARRALDEPVVNISYYTARAFAARLGARLPTEVEWLYAASERGQLSSGECEEHDLHALAAAGWRKGVQSRRVVAGIRSVYEAMFCGGLFGLHGNAAEWLDGRQDRPSPTYQTLVRRSTNDVTTLFKQLRWGLFGSARQRWAPPGIMDGDFGFRLVVDLPDPDIDHTIDARDIGRP